MKSVLSSFILLFICFKVIAQKTTLSNIDRKAILQRIKQSKEDSNRVLAYIEYGQFLEGEYLDSAASYYIKSGALSDKINYQVGRFKFRTNYTYVLNLQGKFAQALKLNQESLAIARKLNNPIYIGKSLANIGASYTYIGSFKESIKYYQQAANIFEKEGKTEFLAQLYSNIGAAFEQANLFNKAYSYKVKAVALARPMGDSLLLADLLTNLGLCVFNLKKYKESIPYLNEALVIAKNIKSDIFIAENYSGLSSAYRNLNQLEKAKDYAEKGLALSRKSHNVFLEMSCLRDLMFIYEDLKKPQESAKYTAAALKIAEENDMKDHLVELYEDYAADKARQNDYKSAYEYLDKYIRLNDSLQGKEVQKQLQELDTKYQTVQKQKQIISLEREKEERNTMIYSLAAGLFVIIIIAVLIYRNVNIRKQIAENEVIQLQQERQLLATNSILKGQEEERTRVARDLHDGLGGLLSGIKLTLNSVKGNVILPESSALSFTRALSQLDGAISEMRRVAHSMMPETLVRFGLVDALNDFCDGINESKQLHVNIQTFGFSERLDSQIEIVLYRIVQELLNNVIKYAEATEAQVQLSKIGQSVSVTVEDNGKGFDTSILQNNKGAGLQNVQARVDYLNGKLDIQSKPGEGTSVLVEIEV
ncbi:tetratricopeptide repeat protein [Dyadobacter subterraneus]|uniref:Sensor histidine kinase n=1 Tax=Dyadobacter subterraneus TaxID=2773304 RepID=A0ABR9WM60_9BACT|nr:sensor histidine kinase [Dyadobacter subterraneus]MBE9466582.1 sensor histidine kinase [Dyadobacter subterraneus]